MDISVRVMLDVSPKLEELVFHALAGLATRNETPVAVSVPTAEKKPEPKKAEPKKAKENPAADIPGKEVPKAEAEKLKEVADLPLDGDDLIELRKQASEFMGKNHKDNTKAIKDWLDARNIERVTLIPRSMVEEFRKDVLGIAG